ncbi:hypothetical protein AVEN_227232-1 [Araneus ventricosus]|uniref:Uncharacterized protein n=1 Tax=Araneus ventricosus TaxID=182803 RepID=A0A4Y2IMZ6_ARAVE|nr:hypothetical protein AVEN_227232-1 [Araneus ventricosus]
MTREPGGQYVGHVKPVSETGSDIPNCILKYLENNYVDINELGIIGFKDTTGPASFSGKIGKQLTNCEKLLIINFEANEFDEINITKTDLSENQQYLLDIIRAIQTGQCVSDLALRDSGPLSHSRWLK